MYGKCKENFILFSGTEEKRQNKQMDMEAGTSCTTVPMGKAGTNSIE